MKKDTGWLALCITLWKIRKDPFFIIVIILILAAIIFFILKFFLGVLMLFLFAAIIYGIYRLINSFIKNKKVSKILVCILSVLSLFIVFRDDIKYKIQEFEIKSRYTYMNQDMSEEEKISNMNYEEKVEVCSNLILHELESNCSICNDYKHTEDNKTIQKNLEEIKDTYGEDIYNTALKRAYKDHEMDHNIKSEIKKYENF